MGILDYMFSGKRIMKKAKLTRNIRLKTGIKRKINDEVTIVLDFGNGTYHAEDNEWACKVTSDEFEFLN